MRSEEESNYDDSEPTEADTLCEVSKLKLERCDEITLYEQSSHVKFVIISLVCMRCRNGLNRYQKSNCSVYKHRMVLFLVARQTTYVEDTRVFFAFDGIQLKSGLGNARIKRISDSLHITDAAMDSMFASPEVCEFRGDLITVIVPCFRGF